MAPTDWQTGGGDLTTPSNAKAAPRRSILLSNISCCTIILTVCGSHWKVVQYIEWIKSGLIFIAQYEKYSIVCGQHCAISLQSLSKGQWTSSGMNNYGYESKRRREKIYFRVYRSISFFTGFVECQEQGLQQQNGGKKKKRNNTNICFANTERDFRMLIKINRLRNLTLCVLTSGKNWSG